MGTSISGLDTWAEVTEMASHIFIGSIKEIKQVSVLESNDLWFHYDVEVIDILMNTHEPLEVGDRITVSATEGVLRASEAKALIGDSARQENSVFCKKNRMLTMNMSVLPHVTPYRSKLEKLI